MRLFRAESALVQALCLILGATSAAAGETRCWIDKGAIVAPATFGDIAGDFILDLARAHSALHVTRANSDGLEGDSATAPLAFAREKLGIVTLPIVDLDPETKDFETTINGVLGADILRGHVLSLDLRHQRCRVRLATSTPRSPKGAVILPLSVVNGLPAVPALASDGAKARSGLYALGTSHGETVISRGRLSRPFTDGAPIRLRALELGGALHEEVMAEVVASPTPALSGAIGTAVLAGTGLIIDERNARAILLPTKP